MSQPTSDHRKLRRAPGKRVGLFARTLLLLFVAWQGPLPWFHCHGSLADCPETARNWLASHLTAFHPPEALRAEQPFSWHFHATMPGSSDDDEPSGGGRKQASPGLIEDGVTAGGTHRAPEQPGGIPHGLPHLAVQGPQGSAGGSAPGRPVFGSFHESFAPSLALPLRFCVLRA